MSSPDTSRLAFQHEVQSGDRDTKARELMQAIILNPGKTARELAAILGVEYHGVTSTQNLLRSLGVARFGVKRPCSVTDAMAYELLPTEQSQNWLKGTYHPDEDKETLKELRDDIVAAALKCYDTLGEDNPVVGYEGPGEDLYRSMKAYKEARQ